ncbi:hypothetical protein ACFL4W_02355 [Planctomycetota bacterium]
MYKYWGSVLLVIVLCCIGWSQEADDDPEIEQWRRNKLGGAVTAIIAVTILLAAGAVGFVFMIDMERKQQIIALSSIAIISIITIALEVAFLPDLFYKLFKP